MAKTLQVPFWRVRVVGQGNSCSQYKFENFRFSMNLKPTIPMPENPITADPILEFPLVESGLSLLDLNIGYAREIETVGYLSTISWQGLRKSRDGGQIVVIASRFLLARLYFSLSAPGQANAASLLH